MAGRKEASVVGEHPLVGEAVPAGSTTTVGGTNRGEGTKRPSEETRRTPMGLAIRPLITVFNTISAIVSAPPRTEEDILILRSGGGKDVHSALNNPRQPFLLKVIYLGRYSVRTCRILCRCGLRETVRIYVRVYCVHT